MATFTSNNENFQIQPEDWTDSDDNEPSTKENKPASPYEIKRASRDGRSCNLRKRRFYLISVSLKIWQQVPGGLSLILSIGAKGVTKPSLLSLRDRDLIIFC